MPKLVVFALLLLWSRSSFAADYQVDLGLVTDLEDIRPLVDGCSDIGDLEDHRDALDSAGDLEDLRSFLEEHRSRVILRLPVRCGGQRH